MSMYGKQHDHITAKIQYRELPILPRFLQAGIADLIKIYTYPD